WTPRSVRPAAVRVTGVRSTVCSARSNSPWTVRSAGCAAHPAKGVPSYATTSRATTSRPGLHEFQIHQLGRATGTRTELEDARVAARALGVARRDLLEQLVDHALVGVLQRRDRLPAGVKVALLGQRDQLLDLRLDRLGLGLGGLDALVVDDLHAQV